MDPRQATYEDAKSLAQSPDAGVRRQLAGRKDLKPELLYFLSQDNDPAVRLEAARNQALPYQADQQLAADKSDEVRSGLARKIAAAAPGLTAHETDKSRQAAYQTLKQLAEDQVTAVRQILAETLKDVADAPVEVIQQLARDAEVAVSGPVLENSPVLTDDDLIDIIRSGPPKGAVGAISRRSMVSELVSDAVVETDDVEAIADLLGNPSAQIREETLDNLVDKAPEIELWHAPMVGRPKLPDTAAQKLAHFVAENMLDVLTARADLDESTLANVKKTVLTRVEGGGKALPLPKRAASPAAAAGPQAPASAPAPAGAPGGGKRPDFLKVEPPVTVAQRLHKAKKLDNKVIAKALHASDHAFVVAAMLVRTGYSMDKLRSAFDSGDGRTIAAFCWKCGIPAQLSVPVQSHMASLPPEQIVQPAQDGGYSLEEAQMAQLVSGLAG
ncbi:MAG: DUF2336 domain-containing protein [Magnetovibrionaceae bacterium]